jgi:hypothetical protein
VAQGDGRRHIMIVGRILNVGTELHQEDGDVAIGVQQHFFILIAQPRGDTIGAVQLPASIFSISDKTT